MARSKVPSDPNMSSEVRRFLDDRARAEDDLQAQIDALDTSINFALEADAEAGTSEVLVMSPARTVDSIFAFNSFLKSIHVQHQEASNTDGGSFASGSWITRPLNTVVHNAITGSSLSSNEVVLPAGTYLVEASAGAYRVQNHTTRLYNVTAAAVIMYGTAEKTVNGEDDIESGSTRSIVRGKFTVASTSNVRLEHRCQVTRNTNGFGVANNFGNSEIYADIMFWKLD